MADIHELKHGMRVIAADGRQLGTIDHADTDHIKLARNSTSDGEHHRIPIEWIDRVEGDTVHLNRAIPIGAAAEAAGAPDGRKSIWPWLIGALTAIILLALLLRGCNPDDTRNDTAAEPAAGTAALAPVTLPDGRSVQLAPGTITYDVQRYLAGQEAAPRSFTFEKLNFATSSSEIRAEDRADLETLAQVMAAYPSARVRIVGYTDAEGGAQPNAQLGLDRARSVAAAMTERGIAGNRLETASGGETNPADTNATAGGRFENRRTEFVVLSR